VKLKRKLDGGSVFPEEKRPSDFQACRKSLVLSRYRQLRQDRDSHAQQIQRIPGCEILAACDRGVDGKTILPEIRIAFPDLDKLLQHVKPSVVTQRRGKPSQLGRRCLCRAHV
jgi:hypothetical protein